MPHSTSSTRPTRSERNKRQRTALHRWRMPDLCLVGVLFAVPIAGTLSAATAAPIYGFNPRADELLAVFFPTARETASPLLPVKWLRDPPPIVDLESVMHLSVLAERAASISAPRLRIPVDHLESYWLSASRRNGRADELLSLLASKHVADMVRSLASSPLAFSSVLEKALFQRDVHQMYAVVHAALKLTNTAEFQDVGRKTLFELAGLCLGVRLTHAEFAALRRMRPTDITNSNFSDADPFNAKTNYLPQPVFGPARGWYSMDVQQDQTQHFRGFRGRSFIHIYLRIPGWTKSECREYWRRSERSLEGNMTLIGRLDPLPAGTETLLVRSFGVFLDDGTYADSGFPEAVAIRAFKYEVAQFDPSTSDYRGTVAYQYKMSRGALLTDTSSFGLRRIGDNELTYVGLFGDIADRERTQFGDPVTTVRFNCIGCHSTVRYGAGTIFTLTIDPDATGAESEGRWLQPTDREGFFILSTPEARELDRHQEQIESAGAQQ